MKITIFCLILVILQLNAMYPAEFLVKASSHWMDNHKSRTNLNNYNARTTMGDIVVVKPNDWEWGKEERLPKFIVIKVSGMDYNQAKMYEAALYDTSKSTSVPSLKYSKRWFVKPALIQVLKRQRLDNLNISVKTFNNFLKDKVK